MRYIWKGKGCETEEKNHGIKKILETKKKNDFNIIRKEENINIMNRYKRLEYPLEDIKKDFEFLWCKVIINITYIRTSVIFVINVNTQKEKYSSYIENAEHSVESISASPILSIRMVWLNIVNHLLLVSQNKQELRPSLAELIKIPIGKYWNFVSRQNSLS